MKILELFAGTKSVSTQLKQMYPDASVVSLDIHPKFNPTICVDLLKWNYRAHKPGSFDMIWASPPCTEFSYAKTTGVRDLVTANKIVRRTLRIIDHLKPKTWFVENPVGLLRMQNYMKKLADRFHQYTVSYCKYGFPYRKPTNIWTNVGFFQPKYCLKKESPCRHVAVHGRHPFVAQLGPSKHTGTPGRPVDTLYRIPHRLVADLMRAAELTRATTCGGGGGDNDGNHHRHTRRVNFRRSQLHTRSLKSKKDQPRK